MSDDDVPGTPSRPSRAATPTKSRSGTPTRRVGTPIRADSPSRRDREGSYRGETGGGTEWTPKKYRPPKRIKPPKTFSSDVKTQNRWVESVTDTVVERVGKFNPDPNTTLDDLEALTMEEFKARKCRLPRLNSPRSTKACLDLGVDPEGYELEPVDIEDHRDEYVDEPIWMLRYEHAVAKRENLLKSLQDLRHAVTERDAINEFRPAKGKMAHVESTVVAAAESMSIQISTHRMDRFHEKTRNWEQTHQNNLARENNRVKSTENKIGESEAYIEAKAQEKRDREAQMDRDNYAASMAEARRLRQEELDRRKYMSEKWKRDKEAIEEQKMAEKLAQQAVREAEAEKARQKEAFRAQTQAILDWQQSKIDAKKKAMEEEDERRAELKRIRDEHNARVAQAEKEDFEAKLAHAKAQADDRLYGRIQAILDKEDRRQQRQRELDENERAIEAERERQRQEEREAHRLHAYNEAVRMQREKEDRIKAEAEASDYRMQEHMAALNFHRSMSTTEKQLLAEDRKFKAEQKAKKDAMERFKLKQKIERETAKAENIRLMREQMRQDAIRTNLAEAERHRQQKEAARKELHHSYAANAVPYSYTKNSKVYGKKGLGGSTGAAMKAANVFKSFKAPGNKSEDVEAREAKAAAGSKLRAEYGL